MIIPCDESWKQALEPRELNEAEHLDLTARFWEILATALLWENG
jgi:hypothetical protein